MIFVRLVPVITINFTGLASTHILEKVTTVGGTMCFSITNADLDGCERGRKLLSGDCHNLPSVN